MAKSRDFKYFVGDFETTVYEGQEDTEVWASACVEMFTEDVRIFHSIGEQFEYFVNLNKNIICYYHNLKFDGSYWLSYLLVELGYKQSYVDMSTPTTFKVKFNDSKDMKNKEVTYSISNMGQWYRIVIKVNDHIIEFRDSLKLLPFSVKEIGKSFDTKHKKLDMEYKGFRYAGCEITEKEQEYIKNDVLVIKEALEIMFTEGHKRLTIGSCCLAEYKQILGHNAYTQYFPNLYEIEINEKRYGSKTVGEYIRKSYRGGWCYVVRGKEKKIHRNGVTLDVNSLYPSVMSSESLCRYPVGHPTFWHGNYIPEEAKSETKYYFIRIKTQFYLKKNKLPFVQNKNDLMYKATEMLETSDLWNTEEGRYTDVRKTLEGEIIPAAMTMTLTMTDWQLLKDHYELVNCEILDGCYFNAAIGIFDAYINKYREMKMNSTGARRGIAKLFLNSLYGKLSSSTNSSFKVAYVREDKTIGFMSCLEEDKIPGYIPCGSAITSYARNFTIRAAQLNYYGKDKPGFIYADTDSLHIDLPLEEIRGIKLDENAFCAWKCEGEWDEAIFVRQKTYIEHIVKRGGKELDEPYYDVKCAGMPDKCKNLFVGSLTGSYDIEEYMELNEDEQKFIEIKRELTDFDVGLSVPGKLLPKRIRGGVVLQDVPYEMR